MAIIGNLGPPRLPPLRACRERKSWATLACPPLPTKAKTGIVDEDVYVDAFSPEVFENLLWQVWLLQVAGYHAHLRGVRAEPLCSGGVPAAGERPSTVRARSLQPSSEVSTGGGAPHGDKVTITEALARRYCRYEEVSTVVSAGAFYCRWGLTLPSSFVIALCRTANSTGLVRCSAKPAVRLRSRSCSMPKPLIAMAGRSRPFLRFRLSRR